MREGSLQPRSGVVDVIQKAKAEDLAIAHVTTTSEENVSSMLEALGENISMDDFDRVVKADDVEKNKPAKDAYVLAMKALNQKSDECVAIEDNLGRLESAKSACVACVVFPNQNTAHHDFETADLRTDPLNFDPLKSFLPN